MVFTANEKNLVRKTVEFDHEYWGNLLFVPDDKRLRKEEYIAMAREALPNVKGLAVKQEQEGFLHNQEGSTYTRIA